MLKRVAPVLWVLALMAGWVVGTSSVWAAGSPKAYVGLFKDDAVAVIDTAQNKVIGLHQRAVVFPHLDPRGGPPRLLNGSTPTPGSRPGYGLIPSLISFRNMGDT